jgi:ribose transport system substrate-binding protein
MRKIVLGALFISFVLAATVGYAADRKPYVFGYSPPTMNNPFFLWIEQNARRTIEANGDKMITLDPQLDPQKQISQIEDLVTQGIDCMLLCPYDSASIKNAMVACKEKGVPIIIFDTPVLDPEFVVTTVASDNVNAGFVAGEDMKRVLKKGDAIAILHSPLAQTCVLRVEGFMKSVGDYFNVIGDWEGKGDTAASMLAAEDVLMGNPQLAAFFCINDPSAIGAVQAIESARKTGRVLVWGVDGAPEAKHAIVAGKMIGTGAQSPMNIGKIAVESAYKHLAGESLPADTVVPTFIINDQNIKEFDLDGWQ